MLQDNFLDSYLNHTSIYESPQSFWKWSAYATIAGVLKDSCYLTQGDSLLFPNLYILFLAESSGHRKGNPVSFSEKLVNKINNTKVISGRSSVQAILDELARTETDKNTGRVIKSNAAIFYAKELSAGIVTDTQALGILTDIYDYNPNPYRQRLRTGPCFNLEKVVFSMLMASNQDMLKSFWDIQAVRGGMLARTCLIIPNELRKGNTLFDIDKIKLEESAVCVLKLLGKISTLRGEFKMDKDAQNDYTEWYIPFRKSYLDKKESSGIMGRIHTTMLKVAMIKAANEMRLNITACDVEGAINECLGLLPNYNVFTMTYGKTDFGQLGGLMLMDLLDHKEHRISKKILIRSHWNAGLDPDTFDKIAITLETAGMIQQCVMKDGMYLQLTTACLEKAGLR